MPPGRSAVRNKVSLCESNQNIPKEEKMYAMNPLIFVSTLCFLAHMDVCAHVQRIWVTVSHTSGEASVITGGSVLLIYI